MMNFIRFLVSMEKSRRAAEAALGALNRSEIAGNQIKLEPSHPGVQEGGIFQRISFIWSWSKMRVAPCLEQNSPSNKSTNEFHGRMESISMQSGLVESGHLLRPFKFNIWSAPSLHPHSLPECHDGLTNCVHCPSLGPVAANINIKPPDIIDNRQLSRVSSHGYSIELTEGVFGSAGSGSCPLPGHHHAWSNAYHPHPPGRTWPNKPSMVNGICNAYLPTRLHELPRAPSNMVTTFLPVHNHHVGSALVVDPSLWKRHHAYIAESPEASGLRPGSLGNIKISGCKSL